MSATPVCHMSCERAMLTKWSLTFTCVPKRKQFDVPGTEACGKFRFMGHQFNKLGESVIEYEISLHGLAQQWRPRKKQNLARR